MMKKVLLLRRRDSQLVSRVRVALETYFTNELVEVCDAVPATIRPEDVVITLLDAGSHAEMSGGLPLDNSAQLESCGLQFAFECGAVVIPILVGNATMPAVDSLPDSIRKLAFSHALPIRAGGDLLRDLGRLISDLEVHLQHQSDVVYPWDLWLLPIGIAGCLLTFPFIWLWLPDAWYWNYAYETVERFRQARFVLALVGPALIGTSLLLIGIGLQMRRYRTYLRLRSEYFRSGAGLPPESPNILIESALTLGMASLGFGIWSTLPAVMLVGLALAKHGNLTRPPLHSLWTLGLVLSIAVGSSFWGFWRLCSA